MQICKRAFTIVSGPDRADRSSLLMDHSSVCGSDVLTCRHAVGGSGEPACLVFKYSPIAVRRCTGQDLALLGDFDRSHDLIILETLCHGRAGSQIDRSDFCGELKSLGRGQFFEIHRSCRIELHSGSSVCVCGRHLYQQVRACLVGINTVDRTGKISIARGITLCNGELCTLDPGHGQFHIFGFCVDSFTENKCEILFLIRTACDHIG